MVRALSNAPTQQLTRLCLAIESLAHIPLELVKPILPNCSAQQLARFEKESPVRPLVMTL
jgi:hypothetical protein